MGVQSLLPLIKHTSRRVSVAEECSGTTLGVDMSCWLHQFGKAITKHGLTCSVAAVYVKIADLVYQRLLQLRQANVKPYCVFDGDTPLPGKALTNAKRSSIDNFKVTSELKSLIIERAVNRAQCEYIVAPYEADPQLVLLDRLKLIDAVVSFDSDFIVHGK